MMTPAAPRQNLNFLDSLYEKTPLLMGIVELRDNDILHLSGNTASAAFMGFSPATIQNRPVSELGVPPAQIERWHERYREVQKAGKSLLFEDESPSEAGSRWMAVTLTPLDSSETGQPRFAYILEDITERKRTELGYAQNTRLLALSAEVGRALTEGLPLETSLQHCTEALVRSLDAALARIWTLEPEAQGLELKASAGMYPPLNGAHSRVSIGQDQIGLIAQERKPHFTNAAAGDPSVGDQEWAQREGIISFAGHPLIVGDNLMGVMALFARHPLTEATLDALSAVADQIAVGIERQRTALQLKEQAEILETVERIGRVVSAELDLKTVVQATTDAATEVSGAQFGAFFYNVQDAQGEAYKLYALSGAAEEHFAKFPMPRNTEIFAPTFGGEGTVRLYDVTRDPRYGKNAPHRGLPEGHLPVRSYLAVPVISRSGEVIGGLLFGHERPGVFSSRIERVVEGLAAQAAVAIDNARLYAQAQREIAERTRLALENEELWQAERERTQQLMVAVREVHHRVKNNLQGVSALLEMQIPEAGDLMPVQTVREGLNQIKTIALVHDLLAHDQPIGKVNVGEVLTRLVELLSLGMQAAHRSTILTLTTEEIWLPTKAATSVALAVQELVTNAEKHSRTQRGSEAAAGKIEIALKTQNGAVHVLVKDNGPGFPPEFSPALHANIGLELVSILVGHDLQGTLFFTNDLSEDGERVLGGKVEFMFSADVVSE